MLNSKSTVISKFSDESPQHKWGLFVTFGLIIFFLGIFAFGNLALATTISIFYVGSLMSVAGVIQIVNAFQLMKWSGFLHLLFSGLFYTIAGVLVFRNPMMTADALTLLLAVSLLVSGVTRVWSSFPLYRHAGWGWVLASGTTTMIVGLVFLLEWPVDSLWLLGIVLSADLSFQGVAIIAIGTTLKSGNLISSDYSSPKVSAF